MDQAVIGILKNPARAEYVTATLRDWGFESDRISVLVGALARTLVGMGLPEYEAKQYQAKVRGENILMSVHTDDDSQRELVEEILKKADAADIKTTVAVKAA